MQVLGIDVGGSGIKAAVVDTVRGELLGERHRIATPPSATPNEICAIASELCTHFAWRGPVGCGFPAAIRHGVAVTAANIDASWIGTPVAERMSQATGLPCYVANDADVAGLAEMRLGAGRDLSGVVLLITIGTGIGTALFVDGTLFPNTELGHLKLHGMDAEHYASDAVRKREDLSWKRWGRRLNEYLLEMERLFWPDLIVVGGGASKKLDKYREYLTLHTELVPAQTLNHAGILGAAIFAAEHHRGPQSHHASKPG